MNNCSDLTPILLQYDRQQVLVVMDEQVSSIATSEVSEASELRKLRELLCGFPMLCIEAKEENKSLGTVERIWDFLFEHHATRKALILNIGGGIVCDLGGFAASTYMRGIDYINIPTTLLSMADAAWGGKTGVNYRGLKNAIGVIRPPKATLIYPQWLDTLPEKEKLSGYAEIIKCGLMKDEATFYRLLAALEDGKYEEGISVAVEFKEAIVQKDPEEQALRKVLNLGHSVGHAIEELPWRQNRTLFIPHGYAVMYGLVAMAYLSHTLLGLDRKVVKVLSHIMVEYYGRMPFQCKDYNELIKLMYGDKKNTREGEIKMVLLRQIGEPVIEQVVQEADVREALDYLFSL